VDGAARED